MDSVRIAQTWMNTLGVEMFKLYVRLVNIGFSFDQANDICQGVYVRLGEMRVRID